MASHIVYGISRLACSLTLRTFFSFRIKGKENIPKKGNFIIASNHVSYFDPIAVGVAFRGHIRFMAKEDLFRTWFFGSYFRALGIFPVKRHHGDIKAMKESLKLLGEGKIIVMFPEGTRQTSGELGQPELGISMMAAYSGKDVLPVFVKGTDKVLPKGTGFLGFRPIEIRIGKLMRFEEIRGALDRKEAYREFGRRIMANIRALGVTG